MKKIFNKIKSNIFLYNLIFILVNILINFILYLNNIRFRFWVIIFIILISVIGFIVGVFQLIYKFADRKKTVIIFSLLGFIPIIVLVSIFMPIINSEKIFSYKPEHTVTLDNKKYVAVVSSSHDVDVNYYDCYGFLLMGTKVKVHGYFGKGKYDPFDNPNIALNIEYTYYDDNGKLKSKRIESFTRDKNGKILDKNYYDVDIDNSNDFDENDNYILPKDEKVLYEKKFGKTILRFTKIDNVLGQNMVVHVVRSKDNGENYYVVSDDVIQVSNEAKFSFLNENLGFAVSTGEIYLNNNNKVGLYVTNNGGKTFLPANFEYTNENVEYITIEKGPYYENNVLKIKCSVYQERSNSDGYENIKLIFNSIDNGLNWRLEDQKDIYPKEN